MAKIENRLGITAILFILGGLILSCSQSRPNQNIELPLTTKSPEPALIIDLKQIVRKSVNHVKKSLGEPKNEDKLTPKESFNYDWSLDYSWGHINFRNDVAKYVHFESPTGYDNFFSLGKEVGVEFFGVEPSLSNGYMILYTNTDVSGTKFSEIRIVPGREKPYGILTFKID